MNYLNISWLELQQMCFDLSKEIKNSGQKYDLIVAIARGGLTISQLLSDFLGLPIASFTIISYKEMRQNQEPTVTFSVGNSLDGRKILLVDDISDTGKTFVRGVRHLKEMGATDIKTVSVFTKSWTKFVPDFSIRQTDEKTWIILPYEMKETIDSLSAKFKKEGLSEKEIVERLKQIKIPETWNKLI
ncbi:hypothetical protein GYA28_03310 [Candidatus Roizmanbacteria bacterium]|jgi:hypoxanthine phosphoribosyltransferase|nr:hypothetical protein [Candidatus Roizmanbacteria bacterium]